MTATDTETYARTVVMTEAESVVNRYLNGRIKSISVAYHFNRLSDLPAGPVLDAAFKAACDAYTRWELAPDTATRALLDEAIEALCGGPR